MRLINADDVKDLINGLDSLPWEEEVDDLVNSIPTAYDIDNIVERIKNEQHRYRGTNGAYWVAFNKAIYIVKGDEIDE